MGDIRDYEWVCLNSTERRCVAIPLPSQLCGVLRRAGYPRQSLMKTVKKAEIDKPNMITQSAIIERGWTQTLIKKFLPEPVLATNPCYASASPMKLWDITAVEAIEQMADFCVALEKATLRKAAAQKAAATKKDKLMQEVKDIIAHLKIQKVSDEVVRMDALQSQQDWYDERADRGYDFDLRDVCDADQKTIDRWTVNYIRHELTCYDKSLGDLSGRVGIVSAYPEFKKAVLSKIAEVYPQYNDECHRQQCRQIEIAVARMGKHYY